MTYTRAALTVLALLAGAGAATAHHSYAMFDARKTVSVTGTVTEFKFINPHTWIIIGVKDPATGSQVEWRLEGGGAYGLAKRGWKRTSLKTGDEVVVLINPLVDGTPGGAFLKATFNGVSLGAADGY